MTKPQLNGREGDSPAHLAAGTPKGETTELKREGQLNGAADKQELNGAATAPGAQGQAQTKDGEAAPKVSGGSPTSAAGQSPVEGKLQGNVDAPQGNAQSSNLKSEMKGKQLQGEANVAGVKTTQGEAEAVGGAEAAQVNAVAGNAQLDGQAPQAVGNAQHDGPPAGTDPVTGELRTQGARADSKSPTNVQGARGKTGESPVVGGKQQRLQPN